MHILSLYAHNALPMCTHCHLIAFRFTCPNDGDDDDDDGDAVVEGVDSLCIYDFMLFCSHSHSHQRALFLLFYVYIAAIAVPVAVVFVVVGIYNIAET